MLNSINNIEKLLSTKSDIIYIIGLTGPLILFLITIMNLWKQKYIYGYLVFYIINVFINNLLKISIKESRPNNIIKEQYTEIHIYGMPSYHAQSVGFSLVFLYLVNKYTFLLILEIFIVFITLYQRWYYKHHSKEQLIIGTIIGGVNAYIGYFITKQYFITNSSI
jgi:membrane-associated phospholipid phosphatase